jgi:hypothetical protein
VGLLGDVRVFDPLQSIQGFGLGPTAALAFVDDRTTRVIFSAQWLPVGSRVDLTRFGGDLEVSYKYLCIHLNGGTFTPQTTGSLVNWQVGLFAGARLVW